MLNTSGIINTIAGNGVGNYSGDGGPATAAEINEPRTVVADASGNLYIGDTFNNCIRIVNTSGIINTIAGNTSPGFSGDGGAATAAEMYWPYGATVDAFGNVYIADNRNNRVRFVTSLITGISNILVSNEVNIYPVPSTGVLTIEGVIKGQIIELYNYTGQKLISTISDKNTMQFDISNYANGIYFIKILNTNGTVFVTKKVVKI